MTPLEYANELLKRVAAIDPTVPEPHVIGVGAAVIACAETRVTFLNVTLSPDQRNPLACDVVQLGQYLITIAHECARTFKDDGSENYPELAAVSAIADKDAVTLMQLFDELNGDPAAPPIVTIEPLAGVFQNRIGQVTITLEGIILITTLTITVGIP
jgi:hypothetical protein